METFVIWLGESELCSVIFLTDHFPNLIHLGDRPLTIRFLRNPTCISGHRVSSTGRLINPEKTSILLELFPWPLVAPACPASLICVFRVVLPHGARSLARGVVIWKNQPLGHSPASIRYVSLTSFGEPVLYENWYSGHHTYQHSHKPLIRIWGYVLKSKIYSWAKHSSHLSQSGFTQYSILTRY